MTDSNETNAGVSTSQPDRTAIPPNRNRRWTIVAALLLAVGPMLYTATRHEIAKWYQAASLDATYNDDHAAALQKTEKALKWNPGDPGLAMDQVGGYMRLGKADEAASAGDAFLKTAEKQYGMLPTERNKYELVIALNQSAYSHALAKTDLEQALKNVERSLRLQVGDRFDIQFFRNQKIPPLLRQQVSGSVDTRGYLHFLLSNNEQAVKDTELAVAGFRAVLRELKSNDGQDAQFLVDKASIEYREKQRDESLAVLLHHRGLAYEAAGSAKEAKTDFERAKELGYDPENGVW